MVCLLLLVLKFLSVLLWFVKIKFIQWFCNLWWNLIFLLYLFCVMWGILHAMAWAICASLVSVTSGSVSSCFLNFDDKHDDIIWSLMLFSISFLYSQYCASCCNWVMYCSVNSFSSCLAAQHIDLSNGIFFLTQKCWSSASSDVLYSVPSRSSTFNVSYMSCVSWPTPYVVIRHFGQHHHWLLMLELKTEIVFSISLTAWILVTMWVKRKYGRYL